MTKSRIYLKLRSAAIIMLMISGVFPIYSQEEKIPIKIPQAPKLLDSIPKLDTLNSTTDSIPELDSLYPNLNFRSPSDSSGVSIADSTTIDTTGVTPLFQHGKTVLLPYIPYRVIRKNDIQMIPYDGISDIVKYFTTAYPLHVGYYGQFNQFSLFGSSSPGTVFNFDGRPNYDLEFHSFNFDQFPLELAENIEILEGSEALIMGGSESGTAINIQERRYNSRVPYTHLWYSQGGGDYLAADGVYSRNLRDDLNLNLGFRVMTGRGEYTNQWVEAWNVRTMLRWNPDEKTSVSFVENFTNQGLGTNGGLNTISSRESGGGIEYRSFVANVIYEDLNERNFRHDLTLSASRYLSPDSISAISGSVFYSRINWNRDLTDSINWDRIFPDFVDYVNHYYGANGKFEQNFAGLVLRAGGEIYGFELPRSQVNKSYDGVNYSFFGHAVYNLGENFNIDGGYRLNKRFDNTSSSIGGRLLYRISSKFQFIADASVFERIPSPAEGINLSKEKNLLGFAEIRWTDKINYVTINGFYRLIDNPIIIEPEYKEGIISDVIGQNLSSAMLAGGALDFKLLTMKELFHPTGKLFIEGKVQGNICPDEKKLLPDLYTTVTTYYEMQISKSLLHIGLTGSIIYGSPDYTLFQLKRVYAASQDNPENFMYDGISAFATARLGNAFVRVGFDNILSSNFYYMPIYPILPRNFRLSLSWSFFD